MRNKVQKVMDKKEKKAYRRSLKEGLSKYYTMVRNTRTGYTKLVTTAKAFELINGKLVGYPLPKRVQTTKDTFVEVK